MLIYISCVLFLSLCLYIWFDSLLIDKITKPFLPNKVKQCIKENPEYNLPAALVEVYKNNLLFQMLSCPFCLSFWINIAAIGAVVIFKNAPIYLYYFLPVTWYATYFFYLLILKLER